MLFSKANVNAQANKIMMKILASIEQRGKKYIHPSAIMSSFTLCSVFPLVGTAPTNYRKFIGCTGVDVA